MLNIADELPAATVTLAGTVTDGLSSASVITAPPDGAGALNVTVPVEEFPPTRAVGFSDTAESAAGAGFTVIAAVLLTLLYVAVMVTAVADDTVLLVATKDAVEVPAATITFAGT